MTFSIQYLERNNTDTAKWDDCIRSADNELIYGYSWYLDRMAENWSALVINNYDAVMPLTWKRKYGIRYLYQPPFCQQLGIFGKRAVYGKMIPDLLSAARKRFPFAEIFLNHDNNHPDTILKNNFILALNKSYDRLHENFKHDLKYNISRAAKEALHYTSSADYTAVISRYRKEYGQRFPHVKNDDYKKLHHVCRYLDSEENLIVREVRKEEASLAASLLLKMNKRLYLIVSVTTAKGRQLRANHFLISEIIKEFSNRDLILDFEGSDLPGVAHFYKDFGCANQPYSFFRYNRLPFFIKWLKG